jgi:hypothetical protein
MLLEPPLLYFKNYKGTLAFDERFGNFMNLALLGGIWSQRFAIREGKEASTLLHVETEARHKNGIKLVYLDRSPFLCWIMGASFAIPC